MIGVQESLFDTRNSELVIGLVAPIGCNRNYVRTALQRLLAPRAYRVNHVRLSDSLPKFAEILDIPIRDAPYFERVHSYMDAGTALRRTSGSCNALALSAVFTVASLRQKPTADDPEPDPRLPRHVHVLDSLKRPEEVRTLRQIYGPGFFLVGAFAPRNSRKRFLRENHDLSEDEAEELPKRDEDEEQDKRFGQQTRDTFHLSDVFVDVSTYEECHRALERFLGLVFGDTFLTPHVDEFAMQAAFGASLRSGTLARQIGAALVARTGELISAGHNEVPRPGGGLYCAEDPSDERDLARRFDSNTVQLRKIADQAARTLMAEGLVQDVERTAAVLARSKLRDVTEYGRTVHAEMEALLSAARLGVSVRDATLYTTTFPCHNCARHTVAAGVKRIVYIEPYPKSEALALHGDAICHVGDDSSSHDARKRIIMAPFLGIAPRRYDDLFAMVRADGTVLARKADDGSMLNLPPPVESRTRSPMLPIAYPAREEIAVAQLDALRKKLQGGGNDGEDDGQQDVLGGGGEDR